MIGFLSLLIPFVAILIAVAWGFLIGLGRTRVRFICTAASFVIALIMAFIVKGVQYDQLAATLDPMLAGQEGVAADLWAFLQGSQPLQEAILATSGAILAPLVFFTVFLSLSITSWLICGIVFLILTIVNAVHKKKVKRAPIRIISYAAAQVILTIFVLVTPVAAYLGCASGLIDSAANMGLIDESADASDEIGVVEVKEVVDTANKTPLLVTYRVLGGKAFCNGLTSIKVGDQKSTLSVELEAIGKFASNIVKLTESDIKEYGADESQAIKGLTDCFGESVLLPTIAGEVIYGATDAWLDASGEGEFLGMAKPEFKDSTTAMFEEPFDHILKAFHTDAKKTEALKADFTTLGNLVGILAQDGVFASMGEENTDALVSKLSGGTTIKSLVVELGKNESFKILISDLTNIGMRAIGTSLNIPENAEAIYTQFTGDIADAMNTLMASEMTEAEKKTELISEIKNAFAESGNDLELEDEVIGLYADTLLTDFASYDTVTSDDVAEFFQVFAEVNESTLPEIANDANNSTTTTALGSVTLAGQKKEYKSPIYAGKTLQELKESTGAGLLANVMQGVVNAALTTESEQEFQEKVQTVLKESYKTYAVANNQSETEAEKAASSFAASLTLTATSVSEEQVSKTASMQSSETLKTVTVKITVEDLLVDAKAASESLNSDAAVENEANAIQNIFGSAGDIIGKVTSGEGMNDISSLGEVAESLGAVLDHMSGTASVGESNTNKLVIAVFQSETVRNSANLDLKSATELGQAAIAKNPDGTKPSFTETMGSITAGADIASKLSDPNATLTEQDIEELLKNMTPQTANMLKVYMTDERVKGFGMDDKNVPITTALIQSLLTEMGDKQKYGDSYNEQTQGILTIFQMVSAASKNDGDYAYLFNHTLAEGKVMGRLDMTADEAVYAILDTDMVCNAVMATRAEHPEWKSNPFGLSISQENREHADYQATKAAIESYYAAHKAENEALDDRIYAIADFLGIDHADLNLG